MTANDPAKELVVLTADKNCEFALRGLLDRFRSLGIRAVDAEFRVHPQKDPGVLREAHLFLKSFAKTHAHALVVMDHEGCGRETQSRVEMEQEIERNMNRSGWDNRAAAVVIDPELESWVWTDSPHVANELGWHQHEPNLWTWLRAKEFLDEGAIKPQRPKEALEAALREVRKPRSSAIYRALAAKVGLAKCIDPAFTKLKSVLQGWFTLTTDWTHQPLTAEE